MNPLVAQVNTFLSLGIMLVEALSIVALAVFLFARNTLWGQKFIGVFGKWGVWMAFFVAFFSMTGSLFYSEVAHFEPCKLCWYQRIAMYPLVLLLALGIRFRDRMITWYAGALAAVGALIAANHYYLQVSGNSLLPCSAIGYSVSCSKQFVLKYGYITIPVMALSAFVFIIIAMIIHHYWRTQQEVAFVEEVLGDVIADEIVEEFPADFYVAPADIDILINDEVSSDTLLSEEEAE